MYKNYSNVSGHLTGAWLSRAVNGLFDGAARVSCAIELMQERVRTRRHLAQLPDHILKDIGISRADAEAEAGKPFWMK